MKNKIEIELDTERDAQENSDLIDIADRIRANIAEDPKNMMNLIANALRTPDGTVLESKSRHDYKEYVDANGKTYMIDGGLDYHRRSANGDEESLCLYDNEPHEIQARILTWGSYGINGDQPIRWIPIADMETDHLKAVLERCNPRGVLKSCMIEELIRR